MLYGFDKQNGGLKSAYEIHGAGAVACYSIGTSHPRFSFPTCSYQCQNGIGIIRELQKYVAVLFNSFERVLFLLIDVVYTHHVPIKLNSPNTNDCL